ncbi:MspA family porin [Nocardia niigatensis]
MRRLLIVAAAGTAVATLAVLGVWASGTETSRAQPPGADVFGSGVHLTASVDSVATAAPGNRTPNFLMTFSHAVQASGDYSVNVEGDPITSGQAVAGFILGCGISVAGGVTVGIEPNQGLAASISPSVTPGSTSVSTPSDTATATTVAATPIAAATTTVVPTTAAATTTVVPTTAAATTTVAPTTTVGPTTTVVPTTVVPTTAAATTTTTTVVPTTTTTTAPPTTTATTTTTTATTTTTTLPTTTAAATPTPPPAPSTSVSPPDISFGPSVGGVLGLTEVLTATLGPGQVTTATTATAALDDNTQFPFRITFNNAALNVAQCASPVSAVPFVTTTVSGARGVVQTTAYGDQFTF